MFNFTPIYEEDKRDDDWMRKNERVSVWEDEGECYQQRVNIEYYNKYSRKKQVILILRDKSLFTKIVYILLVHESSLNSIIVNINVVSTETIF